MIRSQIVDSVADTLWLMAVADAVERAREEGCLKARDFHPGPGGKWEDTDYAPVPDVFKVRADFVLATIPATLLESGFAAWAELTGRDEERFGHLLAMTVLGTGVGLSDDMPSYSNRLPLSYEVCRVESLRKAIPRKDCSAELSAVWNPETNKPEPMVIA